MSMLGACWEMTTTSGLSMGSFYMSIWMRLWCFRMVWGSEDGISLSICREGGRGLASLAGADEEL